MFYFKTQQIKLYKTVTNEYLCLGLFRVEDFLHTASH